MPVSLTDIGTAALDAERKRQEVLTLTKQHFMGRRGFPREEEVSAAQLDAAMRALIAVYESEQ
jgi:hypothetical protein